MKMAFRLIYELVYPAILGSMIYQIFIDVNVSSAPTKLHSVDTDWLVKVGIVAMYVLDWWYTRNIYEHANLNAVPQLVQDMTAGSKRVGILIIDFLSAIGFMVAFKLIYGLNEYDPSPQYSAAYCVIAGITLLYFLFHVCCGLRVEAIWLGILLVVFAVLWFTWAMTPIPDYCAVLTMFAVVSLVYLLMNVYRGIDKYSNRDNGFAKFMRLGVSSQQL